MTMKMPMIKAATGLQAACSVFFALLFCLFFAINASAVDPTNRLDFNKTDNNNSAFIAVYREGGNNRSTQSYTASEWYFFNIMTTESGTITWGRTLDVPVPADYDGDGKTDPAIFRWFDPFAPPFDFNQLWIYPIAGSSRGIGNAPGRKMGRNFFPEAGKSPQKAELGEFQRINLSTPETPSYKYTFYFENTTGGLEIKDTNVPAGQTGTYVQVPVPEDYDGDGKSEVAVFNPDGGCYHVWANTLAATLPTSTCLGANGSDYAPAPGDYDGDGKTDLAAVKPGTSPLQWTIKLSATGTTVSASLGASTAKPVAADYDGDGKTDLAVVNAVNGAWNWTILKSATCPSVGGANCTQYATVYGFDTDVPLASPYFYDPWY